MHGYFNAHCHLELGFLRGRIPPGLPFAEWLDEVVRHKRMATPEDVRASIAVGLCELRETGTRALLDIDSFGLSADPIRAVAMPAIVFREAIDFDPARGEARIREVMAPVDGTGMPLFGLSPHAPYTTTPELLRAAARTAQQKEIWLCIHAAETREETEMLVSGTGALADFLREKRVLPPDWKPPGMRPVPYLATCGVLGPRTLLAHLNDIDEQDVALLRASGTRAVVCPGTHVYFGRDAFPLKRLLNAGVPVYLGTDSLASNESLAMQREIELAVELEPRVPVDIIAELADASRARDFGLSPA